ncbi:MAG: hypothetical protein ACC656_13475 [Candidatus Heimdallarchaeota archaeon]
MGKIGFHQQKIKLVDCLSDLLQSYFYASYRPNYLEFKIIFDVKDKNYFKIINKASNISSPQNQHQFKSIMVKVFEYLLPNGTYQEIDKKNSFIKVYDVDADSIMRKFYQTLPHQKKRTKFKDIHTFYGKMYQQEFKQFILRILNVELSNENNIDCATNFFDLNLQNQNL